MVVSSVKFHDDLAAVLELVKEHDPDTHGWQLVENENVSDVVRLYRRDGPPGMLELNFRMTMPIPIEMATSFLREWSIKDPPFSAMFDEFVCLKSFGPGDVICALKFTKWFAALIDLVMGRKWPDTLGEKMLIRMVTQRDRPEPGHVFFGGVAVEPTCAIPLWGMVIKAGPVPTTTTMNMVFQCPSLPSKVLLPVAEQLSRVYGMPTWDMDPEVLEEERGFIIMSIRKCCKGPPLIPIAPPEGDLEPLSDQWLNALTWDVYEDPQEFTLPRYLRHLLNCFGKKQLEVFDSLDGRRLQFYQASARRCDWLEIWGIWQLFSRRHSSAYRRRFGGTGAPAFQGNVAPKFGFASILLQPGSELASQRAANEEEEKENYPWSWNLPVMNTFVHFPPDRDSCDLQSSPP